MDGTRQRFPGKSKGKEQSATHKKRLTEDEAVNQASNKWISQFAVAFVLCLASPFVFLALIPSPFKPKEYPKLTPPAPFTGALSLNNDLAYADKMFENRLIGPESLVVNGDHIYTGTVDGWVNDLHEGKVKKLVRFGQEPCGGFENEVTCGRPLGMRMDKSGQLVVCDAYHGLFRVNVTTGEYEALYKASSPVHGKPSKFLNDLDFGGDGRIYFTDSSTQWHRNQFFNIIMEGDSTGRLLMYDPVTQKTEELLDNLMFPNGVQLTPNQEGLLVAEFSRARILKYNIKKKDRSVWADGLPGYPDNIRYDATSQTYWVGMGSPRFADKFSPSDYLAPRPWLRGMVAKVFGVSNLPTLRKLATMFGSAEPQTLAVEFDTVGRIISSIQDRKGDVVKSVSEVHLHNGIFYLGSYDAAFIAHLDWKKIPDSNE